jgi:hypothetical protein
MSFLVLRAAHSPPSRLNAGRTDVGLGEGPLARAARDYLVERAKHPEGIDPDPPIEGGKNHDIAGV